MTCPTIVRRLALTTVVLAAVFGLTSLLIPGAPAQAASFVRLGGDGSSWAAPAISQWGRDVQGQGINIDYNPDGSAAGRQNYIVNQADFAGSDVQFLTQGDPFGGGPEQASSLAYSYIPIVAGGTAFMYNLVVGGHQITDLRLRGLTLAKIFTGQIKNWDDPAITADYGAQLPAQPITVVTRSDGSGASYQFTRYLSKTYPAQWNAFCAANHGPNPCGPTEFYPNFPGSQQKSGSDQVASYVATPTYGEGSIAYDEYSYAKSRSLPVVKLLNTAGYFTEPTASNVAIALQAAVINPHINDVNFLIQDLDDVYTDPDPRTYPVSSYSYLIVPRDSRPNTSGPPARFTTDKGRTLSTWLNYVLCGAQQSAGQLGYSPLPKNLVKGAFEQVLHIPGHVGVPNLDTLAGCNNPTYSDGTNHLIVDAPQPSPCDRIGSPLNCVVSGGKAVAAGQQQAGTGNNPHTGRAAAAPTAAGNAPTAGTTAAPTGPTRRAGTTGAATAPRARSTAAAGTVDPLTGAADVTGGDTSINAVPVALVGSGHNGTGLFAVVTAVELLGAVLVPSVFGIWLRRRREASR